jgi:DNA-binding response OmpR family regulator
MKVMYIEDDSYMSNLYMRLLDLEGFEIESAKDGQTGLEKLQKMEKVPDLLLLDIMLPQMDGFEFLKQKNKIAKLKAIPVIVFTNLYSQQDQQKALGLGAKLFMVKSEHDPKELVNKIIEIVGPKTTKSSE